MFEVSVDAIIIIIIVVMNVHSERIYDIHYGSLELRISVSNLTILFFLSHPYSVFLLLSHPHLQPEERMVKSYSITDVFVSPCTLVLSIL